MESYGSLLALTHLLITAMVILPDASRFWDPAPTVSPMDSPQSSAIRLNNVCLYQRSATCNHANNKVYMCKRLCACIESKHDVQLLLKHNKTNASSGKSFCKLSDIYKDYNVDVWAYNSVTATLTAKKTKKMIGHYEFWKFSAWYHRYRYDGCSASSKQYICPCNSLMQTQSYVSEREIYWNGCGPVSWSGWLNLVKAQLWFTYIWIKRTKTSRGVSLSCIFSAVNLISGVALWAPAPSNADTGNAPRL